MREKEEIEKEIIKLQEERDNLSYKIKELTQELSKNTHHFIERKFSGNYYVITDDYNLTYSCETDDNTTIDNNYYNDFNYFHTEEEVKKYLNHIKLSLKILRARDFVNDGWKPDYIVKPFNTIITLTSENKVIDSYCLETHNLTFKNDETTNKFRELISEEEIVEFLLF